MNRQDEFTIYFKARKTKRGNDITLLESNKTKLFSCGQTCASQDNLDVH